MRADICSLVPLEAHVMSSCFGARLGGCVLSSVPEAAALVQQHLHFLVTAKRPQCFLSSPEQDPSTAGECDV
jgi:hypothetical protein